MNYKLVKKSLICGLVLALLLVLYYLQHGKILNESYNKFTDMLGHTSYTFYDNLLFQYFFIPVYIVFLLVQKEENPQYIIRRKSKDIKVLLDYVEVGYKTVLFTLILSVPFLLIPYMYYFSDPIEEFIQVGMIQLFLYSLIFYIVGLLFHWLDSYLHKSWLSGSIIIGIFYVYSFFNEKRFIIYVFEYNNLIPYHYTTNEIVTSVSSQSLVVLYVSLIIVIGISRLLMCGKEEYFK
ncbi:hypothetical protein CYG98_15345 [Listeria monocytogenes serotype 1/2a]|nr:hypothetical protein [Listeria monocytogenes serotype 1/2a]